MLQNVGPQVQRRDDVLEMDQQMLSVLLDRGREVILVLRIEEVADLRDPAGRLKLVAEFREDAVEKHADDGVVVFGQYLDELPLLGFHEHVKPVTVCGLGIEQLVVFEEQDE